MTGYDCQTCGACCRGWDIPVEDGDATPERLTKPDPYGARMMRQKRIPRGWVCGTCAALRGVVGQRVSCCVYEARPRICRDFEPGCRECLSKRAEAGLPAHDATASQS